MLHLIWCCVRSLVRPISLFADKWGRELCRPGVGLEFAPIDTDLGHLARSSAERLWLPPPCGPLRFKRVKESIGGFFISKHLCWIHHCFQYIVVNPAQNHASEVSVVVFVSVDDLKNVAAADTLRLCFKQDSCVRLNHLLYIVEHGQLHLSPSEKRRIRRILKGMDFFLTVADRTFVLEVTREFNAQVFVKVITQGSVLEDVQSPASPGAED